MEMMSVEVLDRIRERCEAHRYYRVGIFCEDRNRARLIQETLINAWPATTGHRRLSGMDVDFSATGSFVRILTFAEVSTGSARGNRFHEMCIDSSVVPITEQIRDSLSRMIVPYRVTIRNGHYDIVYDEHPGIDLTNRYADVEDVSWLNMTPDEVQDRFNKWWIQTGQHEFSIDGDKITLKSKIVPDFGSFESSPEILDYIGGLCG